MADRKRKNRGQQPNDARLFGAKQLPVLRAATDDLSWLLSRGYGHDSALQLVGNRYRLNKRQRQAVGRSAEGEEALLLRTRKKIVPEKLAGQPVLVDGFNLLILLESALSGGYVLACRDTTYRDLASIHGTYKRVRQTEEVTVMVGQLLKRHGVTGVHWLLDQPVSNSGRLKTFLLETAATHGFPWTVELAYNPDREIAERSAGRVVVTGDGWILDRCERWCGVGEVLISEMEGANVLVL